MQPHENDPAVVRMFGTATFWLSGIAIISLLFVFRLTTQPLPDPPERYGQVPEFRFTDQSSNAFGTEDLQGQIWVANFIFTRCLTVCPMFSAKMQRLQLQTKNSPVRPKLVSFSVDPDFDTPEVLNEYSQKFEADPANWHFLTGPTSTVGEVVEAGMKIHMGDAKAVENPADLMHGSHFVLVDGEMNIRGYYSVSEDETLGRIVRDIHAIIAENLAKAP